MQRKTTNSQPAPSRPDDGVTLREVLFEFSAVGNTVKVCAVDPLSLTEATIVGPLSAGESALKHAALQKLRYVLNKQRRENKSSADRRTI